jgi:hypothetical protein
MENEEISEMDSIKKAYIDFLLIENERPKNVYVFAKNLDLSEVQFYENYASFEALEALILSDFLSETIAEIDVNEGTDSKEKLAQLYHAYFKKLTENRSLMLILFDGGHKNIQNLKKLANLRSTYLEFITSINLQITDFGNHTVGQIMHKSVSEVSWGQFIYTLNFWINDVSVKFEKTHVLIDKCINTGFDLLKSSTVESIIDLGKFLFADTFKSKESC